MSPRPEPFIGQEEAGAPLSPEPTLISKDDRWQRTGVLNKTVSESVISSIQSNGLDDDISSNVTTLPVDSDQQDYLDSEQQDYLNIDNVAWSDNGRDRILGKYDNILLDTPMVTGEDNMALQSDVTDEETVVIEQFGSKNNDFLLIVVLAGLLWYIYSKRR